MTGTDLGPLASGVSHAEDQPRIVIAANNGDIGGGEVMLIAIAEALRDCGIRVSVLGPSSPGELVALAGARGLEVEALPADSRRAYALALAGWRMRHRDALLWCNGLLPSFATAGAGPRIVHLHQAPSSRQAAALAVGRIGARRVLVPSRFVGDRVAGATVLPNWTRELEPVAPRGADDRSPLRIGFLGRITLDKGITDLAGAVARLRADTGTDVRLVLGGEARFGSPEDAAQIESSLAPLSGIIRRTGWTDPQEFFGDVDLAIFPSRTPESFGLVVAEAMACQIPFVITDAGALAEVAGPGHPWVARAGDPGSLADAIDRKSVV